MKPHGIYLTWNNVSAQIKNKKILTNVTGYCNPGSTLAIMGPSGAGKTTLLSILGKKYSSSLTVSGEVFANNQQYDQTSFYNFASYVYQNDILSDSLTVRQTLQFTAKLKIKDKQKGQHRVEELVNDFNLHRCQNTYVGGKMIKGISGGQKKRVCIALEMVSRPDMLILDQPTSGLDSHMANSVIQIFTKLAKKQGRTMIFTIHQPSFKIFTQLDRLLLLDKGQCIYQGPAANILSYMKSLSILIPPKSSVCDYFMLQISQYKAKVQNYKTKLNKKAYTQKLQQNINKQITEIKQICPDGYSKLKVSSSFYQQLSILLQRQTKIMLRDPMNMVRMLLSNILMIFVIGLVFLHRISQNRPHVNQPYSDQFSLWFYFMQAQGAMFITACAPILAGIFSVALVFPGERQIYFKQTSSKTYTAFPYFLSKVLPKLFGIIICQIVFAQGSYWMVGYSYEIYKFLKYIFIQISLSIMGCSIGFLTSSMFKTVRQSSTLTPTLIIPLMLFSGLHNKLDSIPKWISWFQYFSPFRYGLQSQLTNQFSNQIYHLQDGSIYNYKHDFSVNLTFWENISCIYIASLGYFVLSFLFLYKVSSKISV